MGRAPCCEKSGLKKGPWTLEEDQKLIDYIHKHGCGNWRTLPKNAGLQRCGKSCRLRWTNYLRPDIKRGRFSSEEEETIIQLHSILGNKWSTIAARLPGRTDNEIKNYWNTHIRKRLLRMGIDPVTHTPRLDLSPILLNPSLQMQINPHLLSLATSLLSSQQLMQTIPPIPTLTAQPQPRLHHLMQNLQAHQNDDSVYSAGLRGDNYANYGWSDQSMVDPAQSSETSTFHESNSSSYYNMGLQSVMSTPSSSPTTLHTEMENYCTNILNFEIPADIFGVADFI